MYCLDDKATVPVGEPGKPQATGVRGHNRSLASLDGPLQSALDQDFHVTGVVPSVAFSVDVPQNSQDSFFNGKAYVTCKDKIFQPSCPFRHGVELADVIDCNKGNGSLKEKSCCCTRMEDPTIE
jgi:hypothetical protein